jgi:hypothetical protein
VAGVLGVALSRIRVPLATLIAFTLIYLPSHLLQHDPAARGIIRTVALLALVGIALAWPSRREVTVDPALRQAPSPSTLGSVTSR